MDHIVDVLIEERATKLRQNRLVWSIVQKYFYPLFGYQQAKSLIDEVQGQSGIETFNYVSELLKLNIQVEGLEHLPSTGRAVLMPNHPVGIADGIAVFDAIKAVRPDAIFFANRDAVRCQPNLEEIIIPVEWMEEKRNHTRSKETVRNMLKAFKAERLVVIFPSGRLARPTIKGLVERPWLASGVSLAQKYNCPIIPMHLQAYNSVLYYLLWGLSTELRDMTLFRELLNKTHQPYRIRLGTAIVSKEDASTLTPKLRDYVVSQLSQGITEYKDAESSTPAS